MGKTSSKVKDRYNAKAYDAIQIRIPKGQKEAIKAAAEAAGKSVNGFIWEAVQRAMAEENGAGNAE